MGEKFANDILQEVGLEDISIVLEEMKKDWPQDFLFYQILKIMQEKKKLYVTSPTQVLYKHGNLEDGVFLMETTFKTNSFAWTSYVIYTKSKELSNLSKVLQETARIPWETETFNFELNFEAFTSNIEKIIVLKGGRASKNSTMMFWLPPDETIIFREIPDNVFLDFLDESHMPEVNSNWPYKSQHSLEYLTQNMTTNFGLGLFRKSDKKMLSSALNLYSGGLFVLFTDPDFRGHGYGEIIVQNMVKVLRQRERIPFCTIILNNLVSEKLFRKIGFKPFCQLDFIKNHRSSH